MLKREVVSKDPPKDPFWAIVGAMILVAAMCTFAGYMGGRQESREERRDARHAHAMESSEIVILQSKLQHEQFRADDAERDLKGARERLGDHNIRLGFTCFTLSLNGIDPKACQGEIFTDMNGYYVPDPSRYFDE